MDDTETLLNLAYAVHDGVRQEQLLTQYVQHHVRADSSANGPEADRATKKSLPDTFQIFGKKNRKLLTCLRSKLRVKLAHSLIEFFHPRCYLKFASRSQLLLRALRIPIKRTRHSLRHLRHATIQMFILKAIEATLEPFFFKHLNATTEHVSHTFACTNFLSPPTPALPPCPPPVLHP